MNVPMGKILYKFSEVIEKSGKSYRQIAKETGLSHPTILRLAKAKGPRGYNVSAKVIERLGNYFEIENLKDLIEFED